jgi:hypothetical protein
MAHAAPQHEMPSATPAAREERIGFLLVFLAALCWSLGGVIARFIEADDPFTSIFWRFDLGCRVPSSVHAVA